MTAAHGTIAPEVIRRRIHKGKKFDFEVVSYAGASGKTLRREVVRHPGAVVILPILDDGRLCMIRNWRPALEREILELPAGTLEPGEAPGACARRELIEETGYRAATMARLGRFYTSPGLSDERMTAYLARGLRHVGRHLEDDERLTVQPIEADTAYSLIDDGALIDAKSMLALLLARRKGLV
jgi:ADP-ribose pyrophosphatase